MSDEHHDYSEIYTPSNEDPAAGAKWEDMETGHTSMSGSAGRTGSGDSGLISASGPRPPVPPIHRCPSWEDRIYQVATDGLPTVDGSVVLGAHIDSRNNNGTPARTPIRGGYGCDISVPVYATVKGVRFR